MKKILSIILICVMVFATFSITSVLAVSESTAKGELIYLLQYYCWDFDYTPEYWYSIYTKESYDAYLLAKQKAEELILDENTTDEEVQNMIKEFQTARENLICVGEVETEASTDLVETTKPTENSELPQKTESVTSRVNKESSTIANSKTFNAVNTGDNSSLCICFVVLLLSFGNVICTIFFTKRKNIFKN